MSAKREKCPDCFNDAVIDGICGKCGFDVRRMKKNAMRLPEFHILAGRYMVGRILGAGGFGITYKAYDLVKRTVCAIKELAPVGLVVRDERDPTLYITAKEFGKDFKHGKKRFIEEAELLSRLADLPQVVRITDFFSENSTAYFVMEYLEGVTLGQLMGAYGGRIPLKDALPIICTVAHTLEKVHTKLKVFHRDISPDNIMITTDKRIKLLDFGNAKTLAGRESRTYSVVLKHGYAPPEQYSSKSPQGSFTDVYSLAATFYYAVSGERLVVAPDRLTGEEYPPLSDMDIGVSAALSKVVDDALVLNYKKRIQTMREFEKRMREAAGEELAIVWKNGVIPDNSMGEMDEPLMTKSAETGVLGRRRREVPYVRVISMEKAYQWKLMPNVTYGVGRSAKLAEIVPSSNPCVSKRHCEIFYDSLEKKFILKDNQSTNGTFVNGRQLQAGEIKVINNGDQIVLGQKSCTLEVGVKG